MAATGVIMADGDGVVPRLVDLRQVHCWAALSPRRVSIMTTPAITMLRMFMAVPIQARSPTANSATAHTIQRRVPISAMTVHGIHAPNCDFGGGRGAPVALLRSLLALVSLSSAA